MKQDLQKLQDNYFNAAVENAKIGNEILGFLLKNVFSATTFYLLFTATLFFFLESKLECNILFFSVRIWLSIAIICANFSLLVGLFALKCSHMHIVRRRNNFLDKAKKISGYMEKNKQQFVDKIPQELETVLDDSDMQAKTSKIADHLTLFQIILFASSASIVTIVVVFSLFQ